LTFGALRSVFGLIAPKLWLGGAGMTLFERAATQHGLISRAQALGAGMSSSGISRRLAAGTWALERPNAYRVVAAPGTWEQRIFALHLSHSGAVISHRSAGRLHGLLDGDSLEVTVAGSGRPRWADVTVHRVSVMARSSVTTVAGVPVTTVARTLVDLSGELSAVQLGSLLDELVRRRRVSLGGVEREAVSAAGRGRKTSMLLRLLRERSVTESHLERCVLRWLRAARLPELALQYSVTVAGRRFRFDMAYPAQRLAIEVDGYEFHGDRRRFDGDRERDVLCQAAGWTVMRFTSSSSRAFVVDAVTQALARRSA